MRRGGRGRREEGWEREEERELFRSRRRHTGVTSDWSSDCALPIGLARRLNVPEPEALQTEGWYYEPDGNRILFDEDSLPVSDTTVIVRYTRASTAPTASNESADPEPEPEECCSAAFCGQCPQSPDCSCWSCSQGAILRRSARLLRIARTALSARSPATVLKSRVTHRSSAPLRPGATATPALVSRAV